MDAEDLELFDRSLRHAVEHHAGAELDAALADLGWLEALADDEKAAVSRLFGHLGSVNVASGALDHVVAAGLGADAGAAGVALPALGRSTPPGRSGGGRLLIDGLGTARIATRDRTLVVASTTDGPVVLEVPTESLGLRPIGGIDPALGLMAVTADLVAPDAPVAPPASWETAVALAQLAVGHELVGASRQMLALAREHALERVQFGRPIAGFQAIRHRLAETLVAIETAEGVLSAGWEDRSPITAAMGKALAGRGARTAARHGQQVLAGIGFTTEHPLHLLIRRVLVLDELFGSSRALTMTLGRDLLETRRLPALLPL